MSIDMKWDENGECLVERDGFPECCQLDLFSDFPFDHETDEGRWDAMCFMFSDQFLGPPGLLVLNMSTQSKMCDLLEATPYITILDDIQAINPGQTLRLYKVEVK